MRRWHSGRERTIMLARWRREIAEHEGWYTAINGEMAPANGHYPWGRWSMAPLPPVICDDSCHCYRGAGYFRKTRPFGCSCWMCKYSKHMDRFARGNRRSRAIRQELADSELAL